MYKLTKKKINLRFSMNVRHWEPDHTDRVGHLPFLLIHGLASNAKTWDKVARRLVKQGHEVVAIDQRNHALSDETD